MALIRDVVTWLPLLVLQAGDAIRLPRSLVYIDGGTYKFVVGLAVPVEFRTRFLSWSYNFQWQYTLPDNITEFTTVSSRSVREVQRDLEAKLAENSTSEAAAEECTIHRGLIYKTLESALTREGADGRACVLRSICEAAETPMDHHGLIGELLQSLLTPDYGSSNVDSIDEDYLKAQASGVEENVDCHLLYPECPRGLGLLDLFSVVKYLV